MDAEKIGKFICKLRTDKNLTQSQLAERIQVTNKAISRWERGVGFPDISLLEPLSNELDISILELLKGEYLNKSVQAEKDDINILLETLIKINKDYKNRKSMTLFILFFIFLLIIFIFYFSTRFGGFNNIYIEQLFNHISLIPFSNVYALICNKNVITFVNNIIINSLLAFVISFYVIYFKKIIINL